MDEQARKIVLGFAGQNRSGKSTAVKHLVRAHGAELAGFGYPLRNITKAALRGMNERSLTELCEIARQELYLSRTDETRTLLRRVLEQTFGGVDLGSIDAENRSILQKLSTNLRSSVWEGVLARAVYCKIKNSSHTLFAIDSVRRVVDIEYLSKYQYFRLCYVKAGARARFERELAEARSAGDALKTFVQFKRENNQESERQVRALERKADLLIANHATYPIERFRERIDEYLEKVRRIAEAG